MCRPSLRQLAVEEGHDLASGAVTRGAEGRVRSAAGDSLLLGPLDGGGVVVAAVHVREAAAAADRRLTGKAVQEGHGLAAGHGGVGAEGRRGGAGGDPLLHGPQDGVIVISALVQVGEGRGGRLGCGAAGGTPEERHHLGAGAGSLRAEGRGGGTSGDPLLHSPLHRVGVVSAGGHVHKAGAGRRHRGLLKGRAHADLPVGHGEGELAVTLVGGRNGLAAGVRNRQLVHLIPAVRRDRHGDSSALGGVSGINRNLTVLRRCHADGIGGDTTATTRARRTAIDGQRTSSHHFDLIIFRRLECRRFLEYNLISTRGVAV